MLRRLMQEDDRRLMQDDDKDKANLGHTMRHHQETPKSKQAEMQSLISSDRDTRRTGWLGDFPDGFLRWH